MINEVYDTMKTLSEIENILRNHLIDIKQRFKVKQLAVFGSYIKNKQKNRSDIDILVEFEEGYKTFDNYMDLKFYLKKILKTKVDLVLKNAVREEFKSQILKEAFYV